MSENQNPQVVQANFDKNTDKEKFVFRFKKDKLGNKRPNLELEVPVPSVEGIVEILSNGGKGLEMLKDAVADVIRGQVASFVSENENASQETLPLDKLTWEFIANIDKKDRRSTSIPDELWLEFGADYIEVMSKATSKTVKQLETAVQVFVAKFSMLKSDKATLNMLKQQLAIYMENTKSEEQFVDILELLDRRLTNYLAADDAAQMAAAL